MRLGLVDQPRVERVDGVLPCLQQWTPLVGTVNLLSRVIHRSLQHTFSISTKSTGNIMPFKLKGGPALEGSPTALVLFCSIEVRCDQSLSYSRQRKRGYCNAQDTRSMPSRLKFPLLIWIRRSPPRAQPSGVLSSLGAGLIIEGRLIRAVMNYEPRQSQDVLKDTECYDGNGDTCNDNVAAECKYNESGKEE